jgi:hypothetical protein
MSAFGIKGFGLVDRLKSLNHECFWHQGFVDGLKSLNRECFLHQGFVDRLKSLNRECFWHQGFAARLKSLNRECFWHQGFGLLSNYKTSSNTPSPQKHFNKIFIEKNLLPHYTFDLIISERTANEDITSSKPNLS